MKYIKVRHKTYVQTYIKPIKACMKHIRNLFIKSSQQQTLTDRVWLFLSVLMSVYKEWGESLVCIVEFMFEFPFVLVSVYRGVTF